MQKDIFETALKRKVSQITFSGHRVNDDYTMNKRKAIMAAVLSAFDEAAEQSVHPTDGTCPICGEPKAAAALHEFCYPPTPISG